MTKAETLRALADRAEHASGPDRELDCLIENALGLAKFERDPDIGYGDADYRRVDPKHFTASLDAAMTLVPEGRTWRVGLYVVERGYGSFIGDSIETSAATPALALTAAALRAQAQEADHADV